MMPIRAFLLLLLFSLAARRAWAAPAPVVERVWGDTPPRAEKGGGWEMLQVKMLVPVEGGRVSVRDARGGVWVGREVAGGEGQTRLLLVLPLVNSAELPPDTWPVDVALLAGGREQQWRVAVKINPQTTAETFRVAAAGEELAGEAAALFAAVTKTPLTVARLPDQQIAKGPPLLFAGCDALLISPRQAQALGPDRVLALSAAGTQVAVVGNDAPKMEGIHWTRIRGPQGAPDAAAALWLFPREPLPRPQVVMPALMHVASFNMDVGAGNQLLGPVVLLVGVSVVVVLLARGLFKRPWAVLLAAAFGLAAVSAGGIAYLRNAAPVVEQQVAWTEQPDATLAALQERLHARAGLLRQKIRLQGDDAPVLFPIAAEPHDYFAWDAVRLWLGGDEDLTSAEAAGGAAGAGRLQADVPGRETMLWAEQDARPAYPSGIEGWIVEGGYVLPRNGEGTQRTLLTAWARDHPAVRDALLAWYEIRFQARHRYLIGAAGLDDGSLRIEDLGATPQLPGSAPAGSP